MDKTQMDKNILNISRLLHRKLMKYDPSSREEYYQEGMLGAVLASKLWDKEQSSFNTYAVAAAQYNITLYSQRYNYCINPTNSSDNRVIAWHRDEFSETPTPKEIKFFSEKYKISVKRIEAYFINVSQDVEVLDNNIDSVLSSVKKLEQKTVVEKLLSKVSKRQSYCIKEYYFNERSHEDIAKELGVGRSAVTCSINQGLTTLRKDTEFKKEDVL